MPAMDALGHRFSTSLSFQNQDKSFDISSEPPSTGQVKPREVKSQQLQTYEDTEYTERHNNNNNNNNNADDEAIEEEDEEESWNHTIGSVSYAILSTLHSLKDVRGIKFGSRTPYWVDLCVVHRCCARILTGVVIQYQCVPDVDCRPNYHTVDANSPYVHTMTWTKIYKERQHDLFLLEQPSLFSTERALSDFYS